MAPPIPIDPAPIRRAVVVGATFLVLCAGWLPAPLRRIGGSVPEQPQELG